MYKIDLTVLTTNISDKLYDSVLDRLYELADKYNLKISQGYYKNIRVSNMYESFEFNPYNFKGNIVVQNMIHIPNRYTDDWHTEFKRGLNEPFTLEDCFEYVDLHTKSKYSHKYIKFSDDMLRKIGNSKDKRLQKSNVHQRHRRKAH